MLRNSSSVSIESSAFLFVCEFTRSQAFAFFSSEVNFLILPFVQSSLEERYIFCLTFCSFVYLIISSSIISKLLIEVFDI